MPHYKIPPDKSKRSGFQLCFNFFPKQGNIQDFLPPRVLAGSRKSRGRGVLPYKGLMGTCGQPGYVFRDFCLKQDNEFIIFCLNQGIDLSIFVLNRMSFLGR